MKWFWSLQDGEWDNLCVNHFGQKATAYQEIIIAIWRKETQGGQS
jgi:hypothetical protein